MKFRLTIAALVLVHAAMTAQHPWMLPVSNSVDDLVHTLRLERTDSVCVRTTGSPIDVDGSQVPDSVLHAINLLFTEKLEERGKGAKIIGPCAGQGSVNLSTTVTAAGDRGWRIGPEATHEASERLWSAVFYLPLIDLMPEVRTINDEFNPNYFDLPQLPANATVLRMSGALIEGKLIEANGIDLVVEVPRKRRKPKTLALHKSEVFSVTFETGEWLLYAPDVLLGDDLTADEMRIYIAGQQDARANYNALPTTLVGVLVGAGGAIFASGGLILTILPPIAYGGAQFIPVLRIREATITNPEHRFNDIYADGYERVARSRKVLGGFKGGALGMVAGVAAWFLILQ